jgi:DNA-binding CsgD family transcriptional regulator
MQYDNTNLDREILIGEPLTDREIEMLRLTAKGMTAREIAKELFLAPETVRGHKKAAIHKLDAKNGAHAVAIAIGLGIVNIDEIVTVE